MKPRPAQTQNGIFEPNMTPLIDVSLVLVVILMVATPLAFQSAIAVRTASSSAQTAPVKSDADRIEVYIQGDGNLRLDRQPITRENLVMAIQNRLGGSRTRMVVVRCEPTVSHGQVVGVLDDARTAGAAQIALAETH
jgi:biopolymer transport protein ExbD